MNSDDHGRTSTAVDYDPFADAPLARVVPSTESQREIWLAAKLEAEASLAYNESVSLRLHGSLDTHALDAALQSLVNRHEALRATLSADGEDFCIAEHVDLTLVRRDLSTLAPAARDAEIAATLRRVVETPFDLEKGPLLVAELLRIGTEEHLLVLNTHHIVCDGWSFGVIARELATCYTAAVAGAAPALAPADSFAEFALAETARKGSDAQRADEAYWLARFASVPPPLELPLDRARSRRRTFASRREDRTLDADLVGAIRKAGAKRSASLYATLLTAFGVLLQRLSGDDDLVIGIPAAGQAADGHHALVGHAVNVLPLRARIDASEPFANVLDRVRSDLLDAFEHQQYTFGTLLKRLALPRDPAQLPLLGVLFNLDQALDADSLAFAGLRCEFAGVPRSFENFELFINAVQVDGALRLECQYNSDLFDAVTVARWLDAYATLLAAIAADPLQAVAALPLVSEFEATALHALQPGPTPFARDQRIEALVFAQASRTPDRSALRCGEVCWTYAQLMSRARQIAAALRARGIGDNALVGIALERGPDMLAATLGVLHAGAGYVPLDPAFPRERLAFMAADAKLALLLTQTALLGTIDWPQERTLVLDAAGTFASVTGAGAAQPAGGADAVAYVIYTSGSTGKPKGVRVPHRCVVNFLTSMRREPGLADGDRLLAVTTLSFDIAVLELFLPLSVGAEVILASHAESSDGRALAELIERHAATVMQGTPSTWRLLLEADWPGRADFKALCGGEALPVDLAQALQARCGEVWNLYGPTETTVWSTCWRVEHPERGIVIGRPIANTTVWILDAACAPCPIGVPGEIAIGGEGVTLGYIDRPELSIDRFIADPFASAPGARLYRTGDRGRWRNDGMIEHLGRLDFQVKLRGFRIELGEVEANLMDHPAIARAIALVREDRPGDQRLIAYLTMRVGASVDATALRAHLRATLPDYMLPQHYVMLDAIPLLANGKINRKALPAPFAQADAESRAHVAPRNEVEQRIAAAMEATLALPGIGIHDDFFALGGHSLLAAQLTARLSRDFDVPLSLRTLFDTPSIAGLAKTIAAHRTTGATRVIERRADQHRAPLSLLQKRLWLFEQMNPGSVVYNTPSAHRLRGALDEVAFERAFRAMVQRQPVLRTSIDNDDGDLVQCIHDEFALDLFPAEDLSELADAAREARLMQRLEELTNRPFDLATAPLFRVRMFRLAPEEHVLFFMPHHIVWDGWSFDLFYDEFAALYGAFCDGREASLPALPVSYGDFAAWHTQWLQGEEYATQVRNRFAFWRDRFEANGALRALPTDTPRRDGEASLGGQTQWLTVPKALTEATREFARRHDATLYVVLLAAYAALLQRMSGATHLTIGTPVRVRSSIEVEQVMGLFTNLLPLPIDIDPSMRVAELVTGVKQAVLDGFASPDVQMEDLMREPGMREVAADTLLYQAQFSFQDARQRIREWGGLHQQQVPLFQRGVADDLALWFLDHGDGLIGGVLYRTDLFHDESMRVLAQCYVELLERIIADPQQSIATLIRITHSELDQLRHWNATDGVAVAPRGIHEAFAIQAARAPTRTALRLGSWETNYAEIDQRANRITACLQARGVQSGSVIALVREHSADRLAAIFAILRLGAICVLLDPADSAEHLHDLLADSEATVLVGQSALETALGWPRARALWFDLDATELLAATGEHPHVAPPGDPEAIAFVVYEGDTSEVARGIGLTHAGVANVLDHLRLQPGISDGDTLLATAAPATAWSIIECLLAASTGAELIQASHNEAASGESLAHLLIDATLMFAPAAAWRTLLTTGWSGNAQLKAVCTGAAPDLDLAVALDERCAELWTVFGATPATVVSSCGRIDAAIQGVHAGRPIGHTSVWALDTGRHPCPPGTFGTLYVGGLGIARAHGRRAMASDDARKTHPLTGACLLDSGQRGRWRVDGNIEVLASDAIATKASTKAPHEPGLTGSDDEPYNAAEQWLAGLWRELLGVPHVGALDNFFDLGGHSLLAMSMVARVEKQTRVRLNILRVAGGSLRALAAELPEDPAAVVAAPTLGQRMRNLFGLGQRE